MHTTTSSLRKVNEDSRLRPFLSPLFDSQSYIKNVIKDGKSEECFGLITKGVDDISSEIRSYISQHKDDLMSGMQDVTALADRYSNLSVRSQKLHRNIQRLKSEATESHTLVTNRTSELERIHTTSILLHQLKAFVHAKAALDEHITGAKDGELRNLAGAARTLSELERLLQSPQLLEINMVAACAAEVRALGKKVRVLAQEQLLGAVAEKNQAGIAASLQVFYNLEALPEVLLLVVDTVVKKAVDASRGALDLEGVQALLQGESTHPSAAIPALGGTPQAPPSASKRGLSGAGAATQPAASAGQARMVIRELGHTWASAVLELALQVHSVQRVVAKKEDPVSHERFLAVLQRLAAQDHRGQQHRTVAPGAGSNSSTALLSRGQLVELFWQRLSVALQDVCTDKAKHFAVASSRAYPQLRKAALGVLQNLRAWSDGSEGPARSVFHDTSNAAAADDLVEEYSTPATCLGMFGSSLWSTEDLLGSGGCGAPFSPLRKGLDERSTNAESTAVQGQQQAKDEGQEPAILSGLKPLRDKYLMLSFQRMAAPIAQMFPELEGYTAAIPSKRDMQALTKAMQAEFQLVVQEGEPSLAQLLCRELLKTVKLMLSKVEGMVLVTPDSHTLTAANGFARTQAQTHNANLLQLLVQFKDAVLKSPDQVMQVAASATGTHEGAAENERTRVALQEAVDSAAQLIEDLARSQILQPVVDLVCAYATSVVLDLHGEGVVTGIPPASPGLSAAGTPAPTTGSNLSGYTGKTPQVAVGVGQPSLAHLDASALECSAAVQTLLRNVPTLLRSQLLNLPACQALSWAVDEVQARCMHAYVTVAALMRPVTEASRLRTAKDLAALEIMLASVAGSGVTANCPVLSEYRAFRRLLFEFEQKAAQGPPATPAGHKAGNQATAASPPDAEALLRLPYLQSLRPSTLLGYLVACAPPLLPSPYEVAAAARQGGGTASGDALNRYISMLTVVPARDERVSAVTSVRDLYPQYRASGRGDGTVEGGWRSLEGEVKSWESVQQALDVFSQRISVADASQRATLRAWYEVVATVGSKLFV